MTFAFRISARGCVCIVVFCMFDVYFYDISNLEFVSVLYCIVCVTFAFRISAI